jgi:predicted amidohydrolase
MPYLKVTFVQSDLAWEDPGANRTRSDDLLFVADWPAARAAHWTTLLRARAIESQAYGLGGNRVGRDGNAHAYTGDSLVLDPPGQVVFHADGREAAQTVVLDHAVLEDYRRTFPAWRDADALNLTIPPEGACLK